MTVARIRRPTCEARPAAWKASPSTYTPPWKYRTTWRGSIPSMVMSAVGTPPSAAAVTVTPAGSGCADISSRSSRRCSLISMSAGKADCRRIASRFSRCSVLTEDLPSGGLVRSALTGQGLPSGTAGSCRTGGVCLGLCRCYPVVCRGRRALLAQWPGAEQGSGDDGAEREDAGGPPERGVVAVRQRQPGEGLAADEPGRGEVRGDVGGDGGGEDGVQQRRADRSAEHLAHGNGCGGNSSV